MHLRRVHGIGTQPVDIGHILIVYQPIISHSSTGREHEIIHSIYMLLSGSIGMTALDPSRRHCGLSLYWPSDS